MDMLPFSAKHARQVVGFMRQHMGKRLICHCKGGISRSSAMVRFYAAVTGGKALRYPELAPSSFYNWLVYKMLADAWVESGGEALPEADAAKG